jgi:hypothetical protein
MLYFIAAGTSTFAVVAPVAVVATSLICTVDVWSI